MLTTHMALCEQRLLATSKIPSTSGHSLHKGTPREAFIKQFLQEHLSERVAIGSGEIIDCDSRPGDPRHQNDIVVYKREYPKLHFGGDIHAFLVESVIATIEVKSTLTKDECRNAVRHAHGLKQLKPSVSRIISAGHTPPAVASYIAAYDGPAHMETVYSWIEEFHKELGISNPPMPDSGGGRLAIASPSIDGIFVLGRGFLYFDNVAIGIITDDHRRIKPDIRWAIVNIETGALLFLFVQLTSATSNLIGSWLDPRAIAHSA